MAQRLCQAHCQENKLKVAESPLLTARRGGLTVYATPWSQKRGRHFGSLSFFQQYCGPIFGAGFWPHFWDHERANRSCSTVLTARISSICLRQPSFCNASRHGHTHTDPYSIVKKKNIYILLLLLFYSHILLYIFNYIFLYIIFSYCCYYYILYIWGPISIHKSHHSPAKTYELTIFGAHDAINCHKSQQLIRVSRSHLLRLRLLLRLPGACWSALRGDRRRPWRPATQRPWRKWRTRRSGQGSPGVTMETRAVNRCIWACWWYFVA